MDYEEQRKDNADEQAVPIAGQEMALLPIAANHRTDDLLKLPTTSLTALSKEEFANFANTLPLESVVQNIRYCHQQAENNFLEGTDRLKRGFEWACGAGLFLLWTKENVLKHGELEQWVRDNCPFNERQAQRYMRLVKKWPEIQAKATSEDAFPRSINGLLQFVAEDQSSEDQTRPDEDPRRSSGADGGDPDTPDLQDVATGEKDDPSAATPPDKRNEDDINDKPKLNATDESPKGVRPSTAELVQIMYRGLSAAKEVEKLEPAKNTLYFQYGEFRVQVTCKIVKIPKEGPDAGGQTRRPAKKAAVSGRRQKATRTKRTKERIP